MKTVAVFFDFDGIWFSPEKSWRVKDIRAGVVGTPISGQRACWDLNRFRKGKEHLKISDCYSIPLLEWDIVSLKDNANITPPQLLWEAARRHKLRSHDLFILSQTDCSELLQMMNINPKNLDDLQIQADPFRDIKFLSEFSLKNEIDKSIDFHIERKLKRLLSYLRYTAQNQYSEKSFPASARPKKIYDQIFLYYTQVQYQKFLEEALEKYQSVLAARRMAIVSSYIAKIK